MALTEEQKESRRQRKAQREADMNELYRQERDRIQAEAMQHQLDYEKFIQNLRDNPTISEAKIRPDLERMGFVFQMPAPPYVIDFFHPHYRLAIEIDGYSHVGRESQDEKRERVLLTAIPAILRFSDDAVKSNMGQCLLIVERALEMLEAMEDINSSQVSLKAVWKCARNKFQMTEIQAIRALHAMGIQGKKANLVTD